MALIFVLYSPYGDRAVPQLTEIRNTCVERAAARRRRVRRGTGRARRGDRARRVTPGVGAQRRASRRTTRAGRCADMVTFTVGDPVPHSRRVGFTVHGSTP
jgi:hypothetical protein